MWTEGIRETEDGRKSWPKLRHPSSALRGLCSLRTKGGRTYYPPLHATFGIIQEDRELSPFPSRISRSIDDAVLRDYFSTIEIWKSGKVCNIKYCVICPLALALTLAKSAKQ